MSRSVIKLSPSRCSPLGHALVQCNLHEMTMLTDAGSETVYCGGFFLNYGARVISPLRVSPPKFYMFFLFPEKKKKLMHPLRVLLSHVITRFGKNSPCFWKVVRIGICNILLFICPHTVCYPKDSGYFSGLILFIQSNRQPENMGQRQKMMKFGQKWQKNVWMGVSSDLHCQCYQCCRLVLPPKKCFSVWFHSGFPISLSIYLWYFRLHHNSAEMNGVSLWHSLRLCPETVSPVILDNPQTSLRAVRGSFLRRKSSKENRSQWGLRSSRVTRSLFLEGDEAADKIRFTSVVSDIKTRTTKTQVKSTSE